ncbi:HNH endonuclease signature motif containing protein [Nocardioides sp. URHA0020]|uniref:HNH endonuclease signature motif containing protein n=1 Tax=Nocardioides sp. URHA0020 TaxID=1380392 RepID=UPI00048BD325|nr:HNH endonuclease signature motif containing protein [Nocardioides sp. URHA0020]
MTTIATPRHQVAKAIAHAHHDLDQVVDAAMWSMDTSETATALIDITRLEARVVELKTRVAAHADEVEVGTDVGATSTANWLAHQTRQTRPAAARTVQLGHDLAIYDRVRSALACGDLRLEQADVIIRSITALPDGLDPGLLIKAEEHLVTAAEEHDAKRLTILGRRLLEVIAPDLADQHESDLLEREEAKATQACRLTMSDDGHGKVHGRFTLPALQAAELKKMLLALAAPKHLAATHGPGVERRPGPERMGRAFAELIERISAKDLPQVGGRDATIVVTIGLDTLLGRLENAGVLDTGERISPAAARRLACTAKIIPVVLGADSQVLDVGRARRFFTKAQLTAISLRDSGCVTEGCDWPPWMCHAHHWTRWTDGGPSDLHNAGLLCPRHHARAHDPTYEMAKHHNGKVTFTRRQ